MLSPGSLSREETDLRQLEAERLRAALVRKALLRLCGSRQRYLELVRAEHEIYLNQLIDQEHEGQ